VAERFSASAPHLREALKDLKAAAEREGAVRCRLSAAAPKKASSKKARAGRKAVVKKAAVPKAKAREARAGAQAAKRLRERVAAAASSPGSIRQPPSPSHESFERRVVAAAIVSCELRRTVCSDVHFHLPVLPSRSHWSRLASRYWLRKSVLTCAATDAIVDIVDT